MQLLEGSIAFALALAGFATICTMFIEILHRVAGWRSDGLKRMLEAYYDAIIVPRLAKASDELKLALRTDFMDRLINNPLLPCFKGRGLFSSIRQRLLTADGVSTEEFLAHLPDTELFKKLEQEAGQSAETLITQLADKYDQFGVSATDYFKRRAQVLSIVAGILLALFGNIHAGYLFDNFVKNPDLALRMQAQAEAIKQTIEQQKPPANGAENASKPEETIPDESDARSELKDTKAQIDKAIGALQSYQDIGLPIGWNYYPNCFAASTRDSRCESIFNATDERSSTPHNASSIYKTFRADIGAGLLWLLTVILTGTLIGLGAPFWFDLAMRLSQVRQAFTGKASAPSANDQPPAATARETAIGKASARVLPPPQAGE